MASKLHLAGGLELPIDVVTQKLAFLGRTGSGKTYGATKLAELTLAYGAQIVALDPVGVWYGLRISADGRTPAFEIPVFGGLHGDIALESTAGAIIADLIVDRGISAVLDVSQFESDAQKARFAEAFASRFFFRKKAAPSAVHLFLEECQEFVPQNPQGGDATMLHAYTRLAKLGRNFGIGLSLISQRPQEINKKVLNMTEVLFAFQMRGEQERKTIKSWSSDKDLDVDIVSELPGLAVGEAFVSSPQWLQVEKRVKIAKKTTADVSSTPKVGAATTTPRELTPIDLEQLRETMTATIEKAKAEDPKELQKRIRELQGEIRQLQNGKTPAPDPAAIAAQVDRAVQAAVDEERRRQDRFRQVLRRQLADVLEPLEFRIATTLTQLDKGLGDIKQGVEAAMAGIDENWMPAPSGVVPPPVRHAARVATPAAPGRTSGVPVRPARVDREVRRAVSGDGGIGSTPQRMLNALNFLESIGVSPATRKQVAGFVGISADTGSFRNYLSELRGPGYIDDFADGSIGLTAAGRGQASDDGLPANLAQLQETYLRKLGATPAKMLRILLDTYPDPMERSALGAMLHIDHSSGSFRNYLSELRSPGLIDDPTKSSVRASDMLFPPGLT